jgi:hypothetical protein
MPVAPKEPMRRTLIDAFRRRPLFWLALAAGAGAWTAVRLEAPLPLFLAAVVAGSLLIPLRQPALAVLLVAVGVSGMRASVALMPPRDPSLVPGRMLTVRGTVLRAWGEGPDRGGQAVFKAITNLEPGRWTPMDGTLGFFADEAVAAFWSVPFRPLNPAPAPSGWNGPAAARTSSSTSARRVSAASAPSD